MPREIGARRQVIELTSKVLASGGSRLNNCDQCGCWVSQRAVNVSPGIECMGTDDGKTQKVTQAIKQLEVARRESGLGHIKHAG